MIIEKIESVFMPSYAYPHTTATTIPGLTKQEYFAGLAMQALISCNKTNTIDDYDTEIIVNKSFKIASEMVTMSSIKRKEQ